MKLLLWLSPRQSRIPLPHLDTEVGLVSRDALHALCRDARRSIVYIPFLLIAPPGMLVDLNLFFWTGVCYFPEGWWWWLVLSILRWNCTGAPACSVLHAWLHFPTSVSWDELACCLEFTVWLYVTVCCTLSGIKNWILEVALVVCVFWEWQPVFCSFWSMNDCPPAFHNSLLLEAFAALIIPQVGFAGFERVLTDRLNVVVVIYIYH